MTRDETTRARLHRKLSIGGFDFYALHSGADGRTITDLVIPAGTRVRRVEPA